MDAAPPNDMADPPAAEAAAKAEALAREIHSCRICAGAFAASASGHEPRPVPWFAAGARIVIAGQAPGIRVHRSGRPFDDPSGARLRDWMGIDEDTFWDRRRVAVLPMAFCFPGHDARGGDRPPPRICARTWRQAALEAIGPAPLTLLLGRAAMDWHLGPGPVAERVAGWRSLAPDVFALPHPSWRNSGWLNRNPWFAAELLPALRARVAEVLR